MSKIKMSFSLILAFLLVGILSTAAFAKDPYGLKPVQVQGTTNLSIPFTYNSANGETSTTKYDLYVIDPSTSTDVLGSTTGKNIDVSSSPVVVSGLTSGVVYNVELFAQGADITTATPLSKSTGVVIDPHNGSMLNTNNPTTKVDANGNTIGIDVNGTGLKNDNLTGYDNTRKNRSGQKVHGFYQNNTNSCASCHQTHTAANGESLLFKDGVYSTCSACHDGTTGAYNNFAPVSADMTASIDGTFNVQTAGHNGSLHEADGSLKISAAPGGNKAGGQYDQEFDCASCHAPHGAGSAGENNLNTDPMGWGSVPYAATAGQSITYTKGHGQATITTTIDNKNGKLFTFANSDIIDKNNGGSIPTSETTPYILVKDSLANQAAVDANFFYKRAIGTPDQSVFPIKVIQMYRWDTVNGYVKDYSLWNRELGYPYVANTVFKDSTGKDLTSPVDPNLKVVWKDAFAYGSDVANINSAVVSVGIDVETTGNIADLYDSTRTATFVPDSGTEMSKYCASCHVDYASTTRTDNTGVYTVAHRHATLQDRLTCVRCHYAHGSEAQIMHDANDNTYWDLTTGITKADGTTKVFSSSDAINYLVDPNPSSALKRYTGMTVCYACHGKGEQFIGSNSGTQPDTTTGQYLKGGDPGTTRTVISQ